MTKYILLFCIVLKSIHSNAQSITLYKDVRGNLFTQAGLDSLIAEKNARVKELGMSVQAIVTEKKISGDTAFHLFTLNIFNAGVQQNDERLRHYIHAPLPPFRFTDQNGKVVDADSLKGKPVVINMWFTTCAPCIAEMPELNAIKQRYSNTDIVFIAMTFEPAEKVADFLTKHRFDFIQIPGVKAYCEQFTENYPVNIFVDRKGMIQDIQNGMPLLYNRQTSKVTEKVSPAAFEKALNNIL